MLRTHPQDLETLSRQVDRWYSVLRPLFLAADQKCLIRGLLLYFYGKRMGYEVRLVFGGRKDGGDILWHCWIVDGTGARFELPGPLSEYVPVLEFT
jgi:hypothetical protein